MSRPEWIGFTTLTDEELRELVNEGLAEQRRRREADRPERPVAHAHAGCLSDFPLVRPGA